MTHRRRIFSLSAPVHGLAAFISGVELQDAVRVRPNPLRNSSFDRDLFLRVVRRVPMVGPNRKQENRHTNREGKKLEKIPFQGSPPLARTGTEP